MSSSKAAEDCLYVPLAEAGSAELYRGNPDRFRACQKNIIQIIANISAWRGLPLAAAAPGTTETRSSYGP